MLVLRGIAGWWGPEEVIETLGPGRGPCSWGSWVDIFDVLPDPRALVTIVLGGG